jgi:hypothetical protein
MFHMFALQVTTVSIALQLDNIDKEGEDIKNH